MTDTQHEAAERVSENELVIAKQAWSDARPDISGTHDNALRAAINAVLALRAHDAGQAGVGSEATRGIYMASKVKHAEKWVKLRSQGYPIISTWIDEAGVGQSSDLSDLWRRCIHEASTANVLILYREPDDILKGGWVELGAALACGVKVYAVGISEYTVAHDKRITHFNTLEAALTAALSTPPAAPIGSLFGDALASAGQSIGMSVTRVHPASHDPAFVASLTRVKDQLEARPEALRGPFKVDGLAPYVHPEPEKVKHADGCAWGCPRITLQRHCTCGAFATPPEPEKVGEASCPTCHGTGWQGGNELYGACDDCGGSGRLFEVTPPVADAMRVETPTAWMWQTSTGFHFTHYEPSFSPGDIERGFVWNLTPLVPARAALKGDSNGQ